MKMFRKIVRIFIVFTVVSVGLMIVELSYASEASFSNKTCPT